MGQTMNNMNMNVKGAVAIAMEYVRSLEDLLPVDQLRLEETIRQENGHWLITLSYREPGTLDERAYKSLEVDPESKEVVAMRIRLPAGIDGGSF
jgi:hypothetical protein